MTQVTVPPMLSALSRYSAMRSSMRFEAAASGQRTGRKESTSLRVTLSMRLRKAGLEEGVGYVLVSGKRCSGPTELVKATISTPWAMERYFSAIAPAATLPMVSRALLLPPPLLAFTPYFSRYVQSAWLGRGN